MKHYLIYSLLFCLFCITACTDTDSKEKEGLQGKWRVSKMIQNGKETDRFNKVYFIFKDDNLTTNLNPNFNKVTNTYEIKEGILISGEEAYAIQNMTADNITLDVELYGAAFSIELAKDTEE